MDGSGRNDTDKPWPAERPRMIQNLARNVQSFTETQGECPEA